MATPFNYFMILTIFTLNILFDFHVYAVPYDYSYTLECVAKPDSPLYEGGIIENPEFNEELKGWTAAGNAKVAIAKSPDGNNYAVASNIITELSDGISQTFNADREMLYTISAWFQVSAGEAKIQAKVKTSTGNVSAGSVLAKSGCWSMYKGGFVVNVTESADLYFEVFNVTGIDIWFDSISMQPFTQEEWDSHTAQNVEKVRKTKVKFNAVDQNGKAVANAAVSIKQLHPNFPFGCAVNFLIINNTAYQKWFLERFTYATFENELKWELTEDTQGVETYADPDAMLEFAKSNGIKVRGHNVLWDDPKYQTPWVTALSQSPDQLREAALKRINSVVSRYKGQFVHWDVINENMHNNMFSSIFPEKGAEVFKLTHQLDPAPILFLNEYNVIENNGVSGQASTPSFLAKIDELRKLGYDGPLGIGLESHFDFIDPNIPYVRAALDTFGATGLPIWITEFTVGDSRTNQMKNIQPLLREFHSHAAVEGIIVWSTAYPASQKDGKLCYTMCLTDRDYKNKAPGDALDKFLHEFIRVAESNGNTDSNGIFEASLVHGEYEATLTLPNGAQPLASQTFNLLPNGNLITVELKVNI